MDIRDIDLLQLLPAYMRKDKFNIGLAKALSLQLQKTAMRMELLSIWDHVDELDEETLDELAWELHIDWYDKTADVEAKRSMVKNSDLVHMRLGTPWAVEQVISDIFGAGRVREWFEYEGDPHHFKILSTNPSLNVTLLDKFLATLGRVKRESSWLDGIIITLTGELPSYAGFAVREITTERHRMSTEG